MYIQQTQLTTFKKNKTFVLRVMNIYLFFFFAIKSSSKNTVLKSSLGVKERGINATQKKDNIWVEMEGENVEGRGRFTGETEETGQ